MDNKKETLKGRYELLSKDRSQYLQRAKRYSQLTLPYICKDSGYAAPTGGSGSDSNELGWSSFGAKCVNNLSNRMDNTLFPPGRSFHRLEFSNKAKRELLNDGIEESVLTPALSKLENAALSELSGLMPRNTSVLAFKHLIIGGNALLYGPNSKPYTVFGLNSYVTKRDFSGKVIETILCQKNAFGTLPPEVQERVRANRKFKTELKEDTEVEVYTSARLRTDGKYDLSQEAEGALIGPRYRVAESDLPFIVLVWNLNEGEHYGRGHCEDYANDLFVESILSRARAQGMVLMGEVKYIVKPNSYTDVDHLMNSPTGEFVSGNIDDIGVLQLERYADFTPISEVLQEYKTSLSETFLINRGIRRNAERVTAYEVRQDAQDLETSLGGVYSHFASTYQLPIANECTDRAIKALGVDSDGPVDFSAKNLKPQILTGIEALGRMNELDKIAQLGEMLASTNGWPEPMQRRVKWEAFTNKVAGQLGLDVTWVFTDEEAAQQQQDQQEQMAQQQMMEGASKAIPQIAKGAMDG